MLGRACECPRPLVYASDPGTCGKCGKGVPPPPKPTEASTDGLAETLAEIALGHRRHSHGAGQHDSPR